ncbi:MAG: hypothetical protein KKH12_16175 [Gammaproteobacteria bacterium]|nr:hypothetical protein [Gammaproteobacteria bacterium]
MSINFYPKIPGGIRTISSPSAVGLDAFGRTRVSNPIQLLDSKFDHGDQPLQWNKSETNGGAVSYNKQRACRLLSVTDPGDIAACQTKSFWPYRAGQSQLAFITAVPGLDLGTIKRFGLFYANDGIYAEIDETGDPYVVLRSSVSGAVVNTRVPRSQWSSWDGKEYVSDPFDGTGPSGIALDFSKSQILVINLQWLGVGLVRVGLEVDGRLFGVHDFRNTNIKDSVYMQTATLPVRYEIESISAAGDLEQICSTVIREGSEKEPSRTSSVSRRDSTVDVSSGAGRQGILGLRLKPDFKQSMIEDFVANILPTDNTNDTYFWELILNPTIDAADATAWNDGWEDSNSQGSIAEKNVPVSAIAINDDTGFVLAEGYVASTRTGGSQLREVGAALPIGQKNIDGDSDEVVLVVIPMSGSSLAVTGEISFKEVQ